jgi:uncharacterized protein YggU (UPF0235/DUF167 family)
MARPRAELPPPAALRLLVEEGGRLALRVTPGAKVEALEILDGRLLAKVRARPEDGKANEAVRDLLARALELAPSRLELLRGATSREKQFRILP